MGGYMGSVRFESIRLVGQRTAEAGQLALVDDCVVAVLVRVEDENLAEDQQGWCLEAGFGPCRGDGTLFTTLDLAEAWIDSRMPPGWNAGVVEARPAVESACSAGP